MPVIEDFFFSNIISTAASLESEDFHNSLLNLIHNYRSDLSTELETIRQTQQAITKQMAEVDKLAHTTLGVTQARSARLQSDLYSLRHVKALSQAAEKTYESITSIVDSLHVIDTIFPPHERLYPKMSPHKKHYPRLHKFMQQRANPSSHFECNAKKQVVRRRRSSGTKSSPSSSGNTFFQGDGESVKSFKSNRSAISSAMSLKADSAYTQGNNQESGSLDQELLERLHVSDSYNTHQLDNTTSNEDGINFVPELEDEQFKILIGDKRNSITNLALPISSQRSTSFPKTHLQEERHCNEGTPECILASSPTTMSSTVRSHDLFSLESSTPASSSITLRSPPTQPSGGLITLPKDLPPTQKVEEDEEGQCERKLTYEIAQNSSKSFFSNINENNIIKDSHCTLEDSSASSSFSNLIMSDIDPVFLDGNTTGDVNETKMHRDPQNLHDTETNSNNFLEIKALKKEPLNENMITPTDIGKNLNITTAIANILESSSPKNQYSGINPTLEKISEHLTTKEENELSGYEDLPSSFYMHAAKSAPITALVDIVEANHGETDSSTSFYTPHNNADFFPHSKQKKQSNNYSKARSASFPVEMSKQSFSNCTISGVGGFNESNKSNDHITTISTENLNLNSNLLHSSTVSKTHDLNLGRKKSQDNDDVSSSKTSPNNLSNNSLFFQDTQTKLDSGVQDIDPVSQFSKNKMKLGEEEEGLPREHSTKDDIKYLTTEEESEQRSVEEDRNSVNDFCYSESSTKFTTYDDNKPESSAALKSLKIIMTKDKQRK